MPDTNKPASCNCIPIILGVLLGTAMAAIFARGDALLINAIFPATAVIGLVLSVLSTTLVFQQRKRNCMSEYLLPTLFSSLALTVLSVLSMATTVTPEFFGFVVLVFLGASSLFISVIGLFMLAKCVLLCRDECDDRC